MALICPNPIRGALWMALLVLSIGPNLVMPAFSAHGEYWRGYWGAGWYTGLQDNRLILMERIGADLGIYRDNEKGTAIGIAASLAFDGSWIFLTT